MGNQLLEDIEKLSKEQFNDLLTAGFESEQLDYKETFDMNKSKKSYLELTKDIMAFANTKGGYILFGVKDKTFDAIGLSDDVSINETKVEDYINKFVNQSIKTIIKEFLFEGKKYILVYIEKLNKGLPAIATQDGQCSDNKTIFRKDSVYVRRGTQNEPNFTLWFNLRGLENATPDLLKYKLISNLPKPNYGDKFVGREKDIQTVLDGIIEEVHTYRILVHGIGGLGKTALVQKVAEELQDKVVNGKLELDFIVWASAKENEYNINAIRDLQPDFTNLDTLLNVIIKTLEFKDDELDTLTKDEKINIVKDRLREKTGIIIIDNWESIEKEEVVKEEILQFILRIPGSNKIIITSRNKIVNEQIKNVSPSPIKGEKGVAFLKNWRSNFDEEVLNSLPDNIFEEIAEAAGGIPIAMIMSLGHIALGKEPRDLIEELQRYQIDDPLLDFCYFEFYKRLNEVQKKILLSLGYFLEPITKNIISAMTELTARESTEGIQKLVRYSLINRIVNNEGKEQYIINPITRAFLKKQLISEVEIKEVLEDNYQVIQIEEENFKDLKVSSMASVISELKLNTIEEKIAASFAASATRVWKQTKDFSKSKKKFEKALIIAPDLGYVYSQWAWVCEQYGDFSQTRDNYTKAIQFDKDNIKIWYQSAMFELLKGDYKSAEPKFKHILSLKPDDARSWHGLGRVYYRKITEGGEKHEIKVIEDYFLRGFTKSKRKTSDRKHNSINCYYLVLLNKINNNNIKVGEYINLGLEYDPANFRLMKEKQLLGKLGRGNIFKLTGSVEKVLPQFAIVKTVSDKYFLHISNISKEYIKDINHYLTVGQKVSFEIIKERNNDGKLAEIKLSI